MSEARDDGAAHSVGDLVPTAAAPRSVGDSVPPAAAPRSVGDSVPPAAAPRREERVTINKEFESFDEFLAEYVTNISRSGVFIRSKSPLSIGTVVNLHFTVIMDAIETIEGTGEVVRVEEDPPGMGVVFTEISSYSKDLIDKLLTKRLAKG